MKFKQFAPFLQNYSYLKKPRNLLLFSGMSVFFLLINLHMTSSFSLAIDNELALTRKNPNVWLLEGRWGSTIIESVFGTGDVPWVTYFFFSLLFTASFIIWTLSVINQINSKIFFGFMLASTLPGLWLLLIFRANILPAGFAYLFASLSLFILTHVYDAANSRAKKLLAVAISILLLSFSIAIYQAFFTVFLTGVFAVGLFDRYDAKNLLKFWGRSLFTLLAGLGIFQAVNAFLKQALSYESGGYISGYWRPAEIWQYPLEHLRAVGSFITENLFVSAGMFGRSAAFAPLLVAAALWILLSLSGPSNKTLRIFSVVGFFGAPFVIVILVSGPDWSPLRSLVSLPFVFAVMAYLLIGLKKQSFRLASVALISSITFQFLSITAEYSAMDRLRNEFDAQLASQIYYQLQPQCRSSDGNFKVAFVGNRYFTSGLAAAKTSTYGASIFSWDVLSDYPWRVNELMRARGYADFSAVQLSTLGVEPSYIAQMDVFGAGSPVPCSDGISVVKLSEPN